MHCLFWESHCSFMLTDREILLYGLGDIFLSPQVVPFKSHCSLSLDPNTLYLAFRYPLLSFSLNLKCSTIYSLLRFSSSVYFSSWISVTCLLSSHCSFPQVEHIYLGSILLPLFSFIRSSFQLQCSMILSSLQ